MPHTFLLMPPPTFPIRHAFPPFLFSFLISHLRRGGGGHSVRTRSSILCLFRSRLLSFSRPHPSLLPTPRPFPLCLSRVVPPACPLFLSRSFSFSFSFSLSLAFSYTQTFDVCRLVQSLKLTHICLCAAVCCSVLQCVAVCCSVLQCVAVCISLKLTYVYSLRHTPT